MYSLRKRVKIFVFTLGLMATSWTLHAQPSLKVAVTDYIPPFVLRGANKQLFGFDISLMGRICQLLQRECEYIPYNFDQLLVKVINKEVDAAISALSITLDRARFVQFSHPYMLSKVSFLARSDTKLTQVNETTVRGKIIGIVRGTAVINELKQMGLTNVSIKLYENRHDLTHQLAQGNIDLAIFDEPVAFYWVSHSSGAFKIIGKPFTVGFGLGIAVNKENTELLQQINQAIQEIQRSGEFTRLYNKYFSL